MCQQCGQVNGCNKCSSTTTTTVVTTNHNPCHSCGSEQESNSPCNKCSGNCDDYLGTNCILSDIKDSTIGTLSIKKDEKLTSIILKLLYKIENLENRIIALEA
jgi:primosomal protein N'